MTGQTMLSKHATRRFKGLLVDGWIKCPHCNKKQFPVANNTHITGLTYSCKMCKEKFDIEI